MRARTCRGCRSGTGAAYRLLTEAEWEYVARAGTDTQWYWGTSEEARCQYANAEGIKPCYDGYESETAPVGLFEPNAFGLYDVVGNVWEWTEDCWKKDYSGAPTDGNAWQSVDCSHRVMRGGSWNLHSGYLRSANRGWSLAGVRGRHHRVPCRPDHRLAPDEGQACNPRLTDGAPVADPGFDSVESPVRHRPRGEPDSRRTERLLSCDPREFGRGRKHQVHRGPGGLFSP